MCILIAQRGGLNREKAKLMEEKIACHKRPPGRPVQREKTKRSSTDDKGDQEYNPGW